MKTVAKGKAKVKIVGPPYGETCLGNCYVELPDGSHLPGVRRVTIDMSAGDFPKVQIEAIAELEALEALADVEFVDFDKPSRWQRFKERLGL